MWDEASQKLKALLASVGGPESAGAQRPTMSAPKEAQVLVATSIVHMMEASHPDANGDIVRQSQWQPWLAPPMFMLGTTRGHLVEGLRRILPIDLSEKESLCEWAGQVSGKIVVTLRFDYASSNVSLYKTYAAVVESMERPVHLHGERCLTHCIHLVKASCIASAELAGMLYSLSKLFAHNRTVNGLCQSFTAHVRNNLHIKIGQPPPADDLRGAIVEVLGIDGDFGMVHTEGKNLLKKAPWYQSVLNMSETCRFEKASGQWTLYVTAACRRWASTRRHASASHNR